MKPAPFAYHAPDQLDELLTLLGEREREVRLLAGGQSLVPMMNFRLAAPEVLVDLRRVAGLSYVRTTADGSLAIGAGATQSELLRDPVVRSGWPLLAEGAGYIGHPQIRNRGTVCGSLAHHDPTAELPALAVALGARMVLASSEGTRELDAHDFFLSYYQVALEPGEMLLEVRFPPAPPAAGWSFKEVARRRGDFALVGIAALVEGDDEGTVSGARLVLCGVGERPFRAVDTEEALLAGASLEEAGRLVSVGVEPVGNMHASAEYRREAAGALAIRALAEALERAARV